MQTFNENINEFGIFTEEDLDDTFEELSEKDVDIDTFIDDEDEDVDADSFDDYDPL